MFNAQDILYIKLYNAKEYIGDILCNAEIYMFSYSKNTHMLILTFTHFNTQSVESMAKNETLIFSRFTISVQ